MNRADIIKEVAPFVDQGTVDLERTSTALQGTLERYGTIAPASLEHFIVGCYIEALEAYVRESKGQQ